jgi:hypothetical protein
MSTFLNEYTVYDLYLAMQDEISNLCYIDKEEQINAIIYCINYMCDYNIDLDNPMYEDFVNIVKKSCKHAFDNLNYPPIQKGESEMAYITELYEAQTLKMIESVIT